MSVLKRLLGVDTQTMSIRKEIFAGMTTFFTMSYILSVVPTILSTTYMDKGAVFTATAIASGIATLLMAFLAKIPFALAPGIGLNTFFAFTIVQSMGYSWETALTAVLIEGILFTLLTVFKIREKIINSIPVNIRRATSGGIGLFIAFTGLANAAFLLCHKRVKNATPPVIRKAAANNHHAKEAHSIKFSLYISITHQAIETATTKLPRIRTIKRLNNKSNISWGVAPFTFRIPISRKRCRISK